MRIEIRGWLARHFGISRGHLVLDEDLPEGATIRDVLASLASRYPGTGGLLFDSGGQVQGSHVMVVYNDRFADLVSGLETRVGDGDCITIIPAFEGG